MNMCMDCGNIGYHAANCPGWEEPELDEEDNADYEREMRRDCEEI